MRTFVPEPLAAAVLTCVGAAVLHPDVVFDPNSHLLADGRDAAKNVYTLAWQLAHGGGVEFEGMAWPYGEHVC